MPNMSKLAGEVFKRKKGLDPKYEPKYNLEKVLDISHYHEEELMKQKSAPDSLMPNYKQ